MRLHPWRIITQRTCKVCNTPVIGLAMWWGAAVFIAMLGSLCGVSGSTVSIPTLSAGSATPLVTTTSPTVDFISTLSSTRDNSSTSSLSKEKALPGTPTPASTSIVTQSEIEMSASDYDSNSISTTFSPDPSVSTELSSLSVIGETVITSLPRVSTQTTIATSDFSGNLQTTDFYNSIIPSVSIMTSSGFSLTASSNSIYNSDFSLVESGSISKSDFSSLASSIPISSSSDVSLIASSISISSSSDVSIMASRSPISSSSDVSIMTSRSPIASGSDVSIVATSSSDVSLIESSIPISKSDFSFPESSNYQSLSVIETESVHTPPFPSDTDYSATIDSFVLPSLATSFTGVATSPTDSEVVPSTQFSITHSSSTPYPSVKSSLATLLFSSHVLMTTKMETSSALFSTLESVKASAYPPSSQIIESVTESLPSYSQIASSESSSVFVTTPPTTQATFSSKSVTIQLVATPSSISPTSSDLLASSAPLSTDLTSVPTSTLGSEISITSTSVEETALPTQLPSSIQSSSSATFPGYSTAGVPIHSTSSTVGKIVPESTSLHLADGTSSVVHYVTSTPIATTTTNETDAVDLQFVNHKYEMVFRGNCERLVKDTLVRTAFWKQLRGKITRNLQYKHESVKAGDIACNPLRISFTIYQVPMKSLKSISSSLEALVRTINITVNAMGVVEHYQAVKLNMAPTVNTDETNEAELEEIDIIFIVAAGACCFVLISAGLVICIREYYTRKRTRTFELANRYQGEDFTLTKIPRPAINYTEKDVDIPANDHSNGDPNDTERLMDSLHVRVNSNENGLMIGITGTLERQKAELDSSPPTSTAGSEHLQFPLVSKETESLQSQDNPIYYIDDEQNYD